MTPSVDEPNVIQSSTSTSTRFLDSDGNNDDNEDKDVTQRSSETHLYVADRSATFSKSFQVEEVTQHCHGMFLCW